MAEINLIIKVIVSQLIADIENPLADRYHVYNLNYHDSTFRDYYTFGYFLVHERKIRMFYVDPQDIEVGNREFKNYFYLNITLLLLHLRKLHGCSDNFHNSNHYNYVCEHLIMN